MSNRQYLEGVGGEDALGGVGREKCAQVCHVTPSTIGPEPCRGSPMC